MTTKLTDIAVVLGMPRGGTTWLYENMKAHPDICVSDYKEINRYLLDMSDDVYRSRFDAGQAQVKLDISPLYYFDLDAMREIARRHDKVILLVREKTSWYPSVCRQVAKYSGHAEHDIESGILEFPVSKGRSITFACRDYDQEHHISQIESIFGDKLLKLSFEEVGHAPVALIATIERFLGIRAFFNEDNVVTDKINAGDKPIAWFYGVLVRLGILDIAIRIALAVLPRRLVHWLRARFVYGR